jgi:hypothetical protein
MNLESFRRAVDSCPDEITSLLGDLPTLCAYVGLPVESNLARREVSKELYKKIAGAFTSGHQAVWRHCRNLRNELIQAHVIDGTALDPYFSILDRLQDALKSNPQIEGDIQGDWSAAIRHAYDNVRIHDWGSNGSREKLHSRAFAVANAAKRLQARGFRISRNGGTITIEAESEKTLVAQIEKLIAVIGGLNVARHIFQQITPAYDAVQERYHLVRQERPTGEGSPQIPFGYLLLLAAKHFAGTRPLRDTQENWRNLCLLATDYAAVLDVQGYSPTFWGSMDALALLPYLQELALYDTLFRIPQIRGGDVEKIARGILCDYDFDQKRGCGWSLNNALSVIAALLEMSRQHRGPMRFDLRTLIGACVGLPREIIVGVLEEALCHPPKGANQHFSKPTDAPTKSPGGNLEGHDFFLRPLISVDRKSFWLLDRSMCAPACLEALLSILRAYSKTFDDRLGIPIEDFLRAEFHAHQVPTLSGKYVVDDEDGECDIVIETEQAVMFLEIKKKPLTRRAQAGSDAHVLLDLANSLLAAQVQAGWHEVRLRRKGFIDLTESGVTRRLELKERQIERIAVSLMQFGSFQDRIFLQQFLEGTLHSDFSVSDASLRKDFDKLNALLAEIRQQVNVLHAGEKELVRPFFHCWFLSLPQLLVLLDGVQGEEAFKKALWKTRHIVTGSSDFYFDLSHMRKLAGSVTDNTAA